MGARFLWRVGVVAARQVRDTERWSRHPNGKRWFNSIPRYKKKLTSVIVVGLFRHANQRNPPEGQSKLNNTA